MNSNIAISVKNISKVFRLFESQRDRLFEALHPFQKKYHKKFWALNHLTFQVPAGQVIGILGRNGSGKSTLLQIICGIMQPHSGEVLVKGRISALLELGAGFNPEFTGRENAFLNGSIMGISRAEMKKKLSTIEDFADIGDFFDQPVKTYSSGMFVRLAFSCAINVDPDILIIDEALAVGDARFQHKCFERFVEFKKQGKTIIFVTHSTDLISSHCDRAVLLDKGEIISDGAPIEVIDRYFKVLFGSAEKAFSEKVIDLDEKNNSKLIEPSIFFKNNSSADINFRAGYNPNETKIGNGIAEIYDFLVICDNKPDFNIVNTGGIVKIFVKVLSTINIQEPIIGIEIKTVEGISVYGTNTFMLGSKLEPLRKDESKIYSVEIKPSLCGGDYFISLGVAVVDGSPGGVFPNTRASVIHLLVTENKPTFNGIADLQATISYVA